MSKDTLDKLSIPSGRIRFAIEAAKEFQAKPGCELDMGSFGHKVEGVCFACIGSVAGMKIGNIDPDDFGESNKGEMTRGLGKFERSLDCARHGGVSEMFYEMKLDPSEGCEFNRCMAPYHSKNPELFFSGLEDLANELESHGY